MPKSKSEINSNKLQKKLRRNVGRAIADFSMIESGDRVMACLSGAKDSYAMLDILLSLKRKALVDFELIAVNFDQKQPGFSEHVLPQYLEELGIEYHIIEQGTYSVVKRVVAEGKTRCGACSRFRRGILYNFSADNEVTKIALGHHRDDIIETLFLNMFFESKLKAMPPKLRSDDGRNVVVRPLAYRREADIASYAALRDYPIILCNLCGSQDHLQRVQIKKMLAGWEREQPGRLENIFRSLQSVSPSHLAGTALLDFQGLSGSRETSLIDANDWFLDNRKAS
jgi:tRNA 2-thiocytidine biosynthesis protein TtcA